MTRFTTVAARVVVAGCLAALVRPAHAQYEVPAARAVRSGSSAYWLGKPEMIAGADVQETHLSPDGRYAVIIVRSPALQPYDLPPQDFGIMFRDAPLPGTVSIVLYDAVRHRVTTPWQREGLTTEAARVSNLFWMRDSETAIATVVVSTALAAPDDTVKPPDNKDHTYAVSIVVLNARRGVAHAAPIVSGIRQIPMMQLLPSPTATKALLTVQPAYNAPFQFRFVDAGGSMSEPISADTGFCFFYGWEPDGSKAYGFHMGPASLQPTTGTVQVDGATGAVALLPGMLTKDKLATLITPESSAEKARIASLPIQMITDTATLASPKRTGGRDLLTPVLMQGTGGSDHDAVLVAPDGKAVGILGNADDFTLLYEWRDALYAVPVKKVDRTVYEEAIRQEVQANADGIRTALGVWRLNHNQQYPAAGSDIPGLLLADVRGLVTEKDFCDPITGARNFQYVYDGVSDDSKQPVLFTLACFGAKYLSTNIGFTSKWTDADKAGANK